VPVDPNQRRDAFENLFSTHARAVHRYAQRRIASSDVEDVVADVFVIAWRKFDQIPDGFEQAWLFRTAWNVLANRHRKFVEVPFEELPDGPDAGDVAETVIADVTLQRAWQTLSARDREVLRLVAWEGLDGTELSEALGISVSGAGVALSRARERFNAACAAQA
jgi:RNA polymerase sigma-70 factor (ECF subfamily)